MVDIVGLFTGAKKLVGLDVGSSALKLAEVVQTPKGFVLDNFHQTPLPRGVITDGAVTAPDILTQHIKDLYKKAGCKRKAIATSLSSHAAIVKKVNLAQMEENELRELIHDEAGKYLPFDSMDDVLFDFQILGENEYNPNQMDVLIVAAKKDIVEGFTGAIEKAGLPVVIMDVDSFALEHMYEQNYDFEETDVAALINIGASITNINVVLNGGSIFTRDFTLGGNAVTEALQEKLGVTFEEAEKIKLEGVRGGEMEEREFNDSLLQLADPICSEIERSLDYFRSTYGGGDIRKVLLCGGSANIPGIAQELSQRLNIETEVVNPFQKIGYNKKVIDPGQIQSIGPVAAVGVGLALRRVGEK
ncbi:MAG TPA: pilus assembly protein PilM [Syntrophus sp. (in: bacteria)]|nr:type IV pilus assembly protein PilM [Smithellaceae bacterium]HAR98098.1 pilus assembly protein PilM [Syntrophus sp. (in: bacteria)]